MDKKLIITLQSDGSIKIDARAMPGTAAEILAELAELSRACGGGGKVEIEKHVHGQHTHTHDTVKTGRG